MIDREHDLSIARQAEVLKISRGSVYYLPRPVPDADLAIMRRMGIEALYRRPRTTRPEPGHKIYPYLLRGMAIIRPNQVWAMDLTHIPMARRFVYLAAAGLHAGCCHGGCRSPWRLRSASRLRRMLWRAMASRRSQRDAKHRRDNTDQGSQFTSQAFTGVLADNGIAISMDGKGAWRDNVFVERLWRSVKYEEVYLRAYDSVGDARQSIGQYLDFYNGRRPHSSLDGRRPDQAYFTPLPIRMAA
jgi:putative transposase